MKGDLTFWNVDQFLPLKQMVWVFVRWGGHHNREAKGQQAAVGSDGMLPAWTVAQFQMQKLFLWWIGEDFQSCGQVRRSSILSNICSLALWWGALSAEGQYEYKCFCPGIKVHPAWRKKNFWAQVTRILTELLPMPQPSSEELCLPPLYTNHQVLLESIKGELTTHHCTSCNGEGFAANWHPAPHVHRQDGPATPGDGQGNGEFEN